MKMIEDGLLIRVKRPGKKAREGWERVFEQALSGQAHTLSREDLEWLEADLVADECRICG